LVKPLDSIKLPRGTGYGFLDIKRFLSLYPASLCLK
jgi:hypothetical protein